MAVPDPAQRPKFVVWANRLWLTSGVLIGLMGLLCVAIGAIDGGAGALNAIIIGLILIAVGVGYGFMGRQAFYGDVRWRSSLAVLTLLVVAMLLLLSFLVSLMAVTLLFAIIGLFGSLLAYRSESDEWYTGKPADQRPARNSILKKRRP